MMIMMVMMIMMMTVMMMDDRRYCCYVVCCMVIVLFIVRCDLLQLVVPPWCLLLCVHVHFLVSCWFINWTDLISLFYYFIRWVARSRTSVTLHVSLLVIVSAACIDQSNCPRQSSSVALVTICLPP